MKEKKINCLVSGCFLEVLIVIEDNLYKQFG
jgi:hypothetical protein